MIVLTSDHGEGLGDHGESTHGYFIYQSTLHVPLIVRRQRGASAAPARRDDPASLIDVAPTLLDLCGLPIPPQCKAEACGTPLASQSDLQ